MRFAELEQEYDMIGPCGLGLILLEVGVAGRLKPKIRLCSFFGPTSRLYLQYWKPPQPTSGFCFPQGAGLSSAKPVPTSPFAFASLRPCTGGLLGPCCSILSTVPVLSCATTCELGELGLNSSALGVRALDVRSGAPPHTNSRFGYGKQAGA